MIGARFVLADGTVAHTGGRVVKNVAGYDLAKLLCGSLGTLAVVTEVAFRLHPVADAARTVALDGATPEAVAAFAQALATAPVVPAACEAVWPDGALLVRVESSEDGAERQAALAAGLAAGARVLDADEADARWAAHADAPVGRRGRGGGGRRPAGAARRAAGRRRPPRRGGDRAGARRRRRAARWTTTPSGCGRCGPTSRPSAATSSCAARRRRPTTSCGPTLDPVAEELMRAVKQRLDPTGTLAPGRHAHEAAA